MRKKILQFTMIASILLFSACSNEELPETETGRTITLTASMPDDDPTTRVSLERPTGTNTTVLKWQEGDQIRLVFVKTGTTSVQNITTAATASNISPDGKKLTFTIDVPSTMTEPYDLYGFYGGGTLTTTRITFNQSTLDNTLLKIQNKKSVLLHFVQKNVTSQNISVNFDHLGSLFHIKVKNIGATNTDITQVALTGYTPVNNWISDSYDFVTPKFNIANENALYFLFTIPNKGILAGETIDLWGWYAMPNKPWPQLVLQLKSNFYDTTRTSAPMPQKNGTAGNTYHFYATLNGTTVTMVTPF